ncbi:MAG: HD-GYP domain-containing protein [Gammaproteobacteria bacterium]|nr:HD-GYP domain-containing protein [Gammaproteobacteria bacterium]
MIKKITVSDLHIGMYVHDLNMGWISHPFATNHFRINHDKDIAKIKSLGVKELYIDMVKGDDIASAINHDTVDKHLEQELTRIATTPVEIRHKILVAEEMLHAENVHSEAQSAIKHIMADARMGKQMNATQVDKVVSKLTQSILRNKDAVLSLDLIRHRDQYTFEHSVSVAVLLIAFGTELGLSEEKIHHLGMGGLLHDIGKTKIPDGILNKPGKLSDSEFGIVKNHVDYGVQILSGLQGLSSEAISITQQHHERIDGSGYPNRLSGDQISLFGQMAAIADVYDAIASDRCYHRGEPPSSVLKKMLEWSKHHFDENLVHRFIHTVGIYPVGSLVQIEDGHLAVVIERGEKGLLYPVVRCIYDTHQKKHIKPYTLDLSTQADESSNRIISFEDPLKWGIRPFRYITAA